MSFFDQIASALERFPEFEEMVRNESRAAVGFEVSPRAMLDRAKIFDMRDTVAHDLFRDTVAFEPERLDYLENNFSQPFPSVCIEDKGGAAVITEIPAPLPAHIVAMAKEDSSHVVARVGAAASLKGDANHLFGSVDFSTESGERGIPCVRLFLDWVPPNKTPEAYDPSVSVLSMEDRNQMMADQSGTLTCGVVFFHAGRPRNGSDVTPMGTGGRMFASAIIKRGSAEVVPMATNPMVDMLTPEHRVSMFQNPAVAIKQAVVLGSPDRFILEETSLKVAVVKKAIKKSRRSRRILRSNARPRHIILKPVAIREILGAPEPQDKGSKKAPHPRRAHTRRLRSDRFKDQGKWVPVRASWVGPEQAVSQGRRYRVLLDR